MKIVDCSPDTWRRPITKVYVIVLVSVAVLTINGDRAAAQGQAWCLVGGNSGRSCAFYTFEQCLASRAGVDCAIVRALPDALAAALDAVGKTLH